MKVKGGWNLSVTGVAILVVCLVAFVAAMSFDSAERQARVNVPLTGDPDANAAKVGRSQMGDPPPVDVSGDIDPTANPPSGQMMNKPNAIDIGDLCPLLAFILIGAAIYLAIVR